MLYAGLDLSRKRLDFHLLDGEGETVDVGASPPDADGLRGLSERLARHGAPIRAAIESMNGARFVHDRLELAGWQVEIADAQKVKGLAPLACKTDRIDACVLAELARRDLVPAIWLPDPLVRAERERARWRLHLVRHRSSLKQRVHAVLLTQGPVLPLMPGVPERRSHDYIRYGTTNLYAALNVASGQVISEMTPRHRAEEFRRFLNQIDSAVPEGLDVHVVLDNSSTHKTPAIQRWLVRHPRFTFHFTPTYSSWLNLVERWFAELTTKWIKRNSHRSVRDLTASIRTWITNWNDDPNPYTRHKSADEILDSITAYCQRFNDSDH
jgi:transposase